MGRSDSLFELIKSMSKSEKRYFKIFAQKHVIGKQNKYVLLFDLLDKMSAYDREAVNAAYQKIGTKNNKTTTKQYLIKIILESLSAFTKSHDIELQLKEQIIHIKLLTGRSIFSEALRLLKKAKKTATKYHFHFLYQELLELENVLLFYQYSNSTSNFLKEAENNYQKRTDNWIVLKELTDIIHQLLRLNNHLNYKGQSKTELQSSYIQEIIHHPLVQEGMESEHLYIRLNAHEILSSYYAAIMDFNQSYEIARKAYRYILDNRTEIINYNPSLYINTTCNFLNKSFFAGDLETCKKTLLTFGKFDTQNLSLKSSYLLNYFIYSLAYIINTADFEGFDKLVVQIKKDLKAYSYNMDTARLLLIKSMVSNCFFIRQNYREAIYWIDLYLNDPERDSLQKIYEPALIYRMLIFLDSDDLDYFDVLLKKLKKQLKNGNDYPQFCRCFISFFETAASTINVEKRKKIYRQLRDSLLNLLSQQEDIPALTYFPFIVWVNAKLNHRTMERELIKNLQTY